MSAREAEPSPGQDAEPPLMLVSGRCINRLLTYSSKSRKALAPAALDLVY